MNRWDPRRKQKEQLEAVQRPPKLAWDELIATASMLDDVDAKWDLFESWADGHPDPHVHWQRGVYRDRFGKQTGMYRTISTKPFDPQFWSKEIMDAFQKNLTTTKITK